MNQYLDEYGEPTYFVQNISNGKVILADLSIEIMEGSVNDLREYHDPMELRKSPGLRQALSPSTGFLRRLTREEFEKVNRDQVQREEAVKALRAKASNPSLTDEKGDVTEVKVDISPKCESMVEKLKLFYKKETRDKGLSPDQFLMWLQTYTPTLDEKGYMLSLIRDKNVREHLYTKLAKGETLMSDEPVEEKIEVIKEVEVKQNNIPIEVSKPQEEIVVSSPIKEPLIAGESDKEVSTNSLVDSKTEVVSSATIDTGVVFPDRYKNDLETIGDKKDVADERSQK